MHNPPFHLEDIAADIPWKDASGAIVGWMQAGINGGIYAWGGAPFYGAPEGQPYWGDRKISDLVQTSPTSYKVISNIAGNEYNYGARGVRPAGHEATAKEVD